jgi:uncharacterized protein (TIGR00296 family)
MLTKNQGVNAVKLARKIAESYVNNIEFQPGEVDKVFDEKGGVFVTIHTYPSNNLRGCIGIPQSILPIKKAIEESAISATEDPRFAKMRKDEFDDVIIEITILTKPELIDVKNPKEYLNNIKIGRDGLIVEQGIFKGLLLPQVPVEQGWNKEEFLSQTCMKAGLMPDAWFDKATKIYKFSGQIFTELRPRGEIKEKNIDGAMC